MAMASIFLALSALFMTSIKPFKRNAMVNLEELLHQPTHQQD
ncbi:hypothetical protein ZBT109_0439 [Zymobacter palmae]|uniref:Uncharacterized protein n=1 Tax=Zymobacter palmae TaxID=33074 RepID=A0A348HC75_9GAMM|nr:hypothetical protein ZBT109_0439 [Zymobacter palmae]